MRAGARPAAFRGSRPILKPGGFFLVINYSYRGSLMDDRRDLIANAAANGLSLVRQATGDFKLWDGATFLMRRNRGRFKCLAP